MVMTKLFTIPVDKARDTQIEVWEADDHLVIGAVRGATLGDIPVFLRKGRRAEASESGEAPASPAFDSELEALQEADWLRANLVDVHREAIRRAASLDDTLAYVTGKCAAVGKP